MSLNVLFLFWIIYNRLANDTYEMHCRLFGKYVTIKWHIWIKTSSLLDMTLLFCLWMTCAVTSYPSCGSVLNSPPLLIWSQTMCVCSQPLSLQDGKYHRTPCGSAKNPRGWCIPIWEPLAYMIDTQYLVQWHLDMQSGGATGSSYTHLPLSGRTTLPPESQLPPSSQQTKAPSNAMIPLWFKTVINITLMLAEALWCVFPSPPPISQTIFTAAIMPVISGISTDCKACLICADFFFCSLVVGYKLPAAFQMQLPQCRPALTRRHRKGGWDLHKKSWVEIIESLYVIIKTPELGVLFCFSLQRTTWKNKKKKATVLKRRLKCGSGCVIGRVEVLSWFSLVSLRIDSPPPAFCALAR